MSEVEKKSAEKNFQIIILIILSVSTLIVFGVIIVLILRNNSNFFSGNQAAFTQMNDEAVPQSTSPTTTPSLDLAMRDYAGSKTKIEKVNIFGQIVELPAIRFTDPKDRYAHHFFSASETDFEKTALILVNFDAPELGLFKYDLLNDEVTFIDYTFQIYWFSDGKTKDKTKFFYDFPTKTENGWLTTMRFYDLASKTRYQITDGVIPPDTNFARMKIAEDGTIKLLYSNAPPTGNAIDPSLIQEVVVTLDQFLPIEN